MWKSSRAGKSNINQPLNDFIIKQRTNETNDKNKGRHFVISFNPNQLNYKICDLSNGFGCFVKIIDDIKLKNNCLVNIGDSYLVLKIDDNNYVNVKVFSGSSQIEPM